MNDASSGSNEMSGLRTLTTTILDNIFGGDEEHKLGSGSDLTRMLLRFRCRIYLFFYSLE